MIEKVVVIKNVNRFVDYAAQGDVTFRKLTLIHAANGMGKTTLSAILRSCRSNNPDIILARKTLGDAAAGDPEVTLRIGGQNAMALT